MRFGGQDVSGIALPSGSDKLYTGSKDETVRIWDCQSGQVVIIITVIIIVIFVVIWCFYFLYLNALVSGGKA